jgi:hypothetical protein
MANFDQAGDAVRKIAGYLPYNPGPGIYSRLEKAIEQMPANVRVQELPGLLKRYKDGVPGWELKAADFDSLTAGREAVPREELLARVKERSPVYTHKELLLAESDNRYPTTAGGMADLAQRYYTPGSVISSYGDYDKVLGFNRSEESPWEWGVTVISSDAQGVPRPGERSRTHSTPPSENDVRDWFSKSSPGSPKPIGSGEIVSGPRYGAYGQGGKNYTEMLLSQPMRENAEFGSHWSDIDANAVAHARYDTHGDALRINELQSDLGIHNRKVREAIASRQGPPQQLPSESDSAYLDRVQEQGYVMQMGDDGEWQWSNDPKSQGVEFPLEDSWMDMFIKRLALETARGGHRAIEIASPRAIADKVGGNIENYEHVYNKVAPGMLERLGRKMGGLTEVKPLHSPAQTRGYGGVLDEMREGPPDEGQPVLRDALTAMRMLKISVPKGPMPAFGESPQSAWNSLASAYRGHSDVGYEASRLHDSLSASLSRGGGDSSKAAEMMPQLVRLAETHAASLDAYQRVDELARLQDFQRGGKPADEAARRYIMSDEMRRRILTQGIGAAVAAPMMSDDDLIERLNK